MPTDVITQHNDNWRTGANLHEPTLTHSAIQAGMHKLGEMAVDPPAAGGPTSWASQVLTQPLIITGVQMSDGATYDVVLVATMHGTVYAFDAQTFTQLWAKWLGPPVLDLTDANGNIADLKDKHGTNPEWGILSTPVVHRGLGRVYVVMWHNEAGGTYRLHALNLSNGQEIMSPVTLVAQVSNAAGSVVSFDPVFHKQRPGLLLLTPGDLPAGNGQKVGADGTVYIAFGASTESIAASYHGWVIACDAGTLQPRAAWCSTPDGEQGGVWQAGAGMAADEQGNIYAMTGNGGVDYGPGAAGRKNYGSSFVKLACDTLAALDAFTPWDCPTLNANDLDLGSAGPLCVPGTQWVVGAGKVGRLYSLKQNNLGGIGNATIQKDGSVDEVQATMYPSGQPPCDSHHVHGAPVYWSGTNRIYLWGENDTLRVFAIDPTSGLFTSRVPLATGPITAPCGMPGGMLSLSATDKTAAAEAIIWAALPLQGDANTQRSCPGVLRAFDAQTLKELWNSGDDPTTADWFFAKFVSPTVANGRVYVATYSGKVVVYGL